VGDEARSAVTLYGQEKDAATSGLARMNMILHNNPTAAIYQGNTLTTPHFTENGTLKTFDFVVANPPFSDKRWSTGLEPLNDKYERFKPFGVPPVKQGDYAYLLHIIRSLKPNGKGACILPHGVLFRGNAEAEIRKNLLRRGYIKGIIGLPPNLFYGTGIYQHFMVYWDATMQDDCYLIAADGWKAETYRIIETDKKGKEKDKGWACDLIPKPLIVARYFGSQQKAIDELNAELEAVSAQLTELEEEHGGEGAALQGVESKGDFDEAWVAAIESAWRELLPDTFARYETAEGGRAPVRASRR
jgi:hypothetical protein